MDRRCYNCGEKSHVSRFCDKPQRYSRCVGCENVCLARSHHKINCDNGDFRSEFLATNYVSIAPIVGFNFGKVMARGHPLEDGAKILYADYQGLLERKNDEYWFHGVQGQKYVISIIDGDEKPRAMFYVGNSLIINDYYHISATGMMKYDPAVKQRAVGRSLCDLKVESTDAIVQMCIKWYNRSYHFDVHQNRVVYIDPTEEQVKA